jgi:hypothetical protein
MSDTHLEQGSAFWPEGARLAVSISMQLEAGGQPMNGARKEKEPR